MNRFFAVLRMTFLAMLMLLAAACFPATEDPCLKKADSASCRLANARAEAQLAEQDATDQAQLTLVSIEQTRTADDATRAAGQATVTAQAKATDDDYQRQAAVLGLTATAQALNDVQAERTRQAAVLVASATASAQAQATADMRIQQSFELSGTMQAGNATATMVIQRTKDAIAANELQAEANRKATEAWTAGLVQAVLTCVGLALLVLAAIGLVIGARKLFGVWRHSLTVRSSTVRSSADGHAVDAPYFVFPAGSQLQVLDTDHIVGAQMLSDGSNQPTTDPHMVEHIQEAWIALLSNATRDQLVKLYQRATAEVDGQSELQAPILPSPQPSPVGEGVAAMVIPTFAEMMQHWRPTQGRMLFGIADNGPLFGPVDKLLSVKVIGRQGTGKTTLLRMIYAQCLLIDVDVIVWDLHEDIIDELPGAHAYTTVEQIRESAGLVLGELERRIALHLKGGPALMVLVDEVNQLANVVPEVIEACGRIVNEGRKYRLFCIISAKGVPATLFGGSTIRDAFSSGFAFQTTARAAAMAGFDREDAPLVRDLPIGRALFDGPFPAQIVSIPYTTGDDVRQILATSAATSGTASAATSEPLRFSDSEAVEVAEIDETKRLKVLELIRARTPVSKIVQQVWGVTGGDAYMQASREYSEIAASLVQ